MPHGSGRRLRRDAEWLQRKSETTSHDSTDPRYWPSPRWTQEMVDETRACNPWNPDPTREAYALLEAQRRAETRHVMDITDGRSMNSSAFRHDLHRLRTAEALRVQNGADSISALPEDAISMVACLPQAHPTTAPLVAPWQPTHSTLRSAARALRDGHVTERIPEPGATLPLGPGDPTSLATLRDRGLLPAIHVVAPTPNRVPDRRIDPSRRPGPVRRRNLTPLLPDGSGSA